MAPRRSRGLGIVAVCSLLAVAGVVWWHWGEVYAWLAWARIAASGGVTVEQRLAQLGPAGRQRWRPAFERAGVTYPPQQLVLVGIKDQKLLEVWASCSTEDSSAAGDLRLIRTIPILAASGTAGPKLREGDRQVPEGVYRIDFLNPNSRHHLSMRVAYPNDLDRAWALADGRDRLGGDIMIHGGASSVGCLAIGDGPAEDLFILVADTGLDRTEVLLCPVDLRTEDAPMPTSPAVHARLHSLYAALKQRLPSARHTPSTEQNAGYRRPISE